MNKFLTVDGTSTAVYEIKHSVFYASLKGITDFEDGLGFVKSIAKKYGDATHNCYAIICRNGEQKFSDDGEPSGTAGIPILQVIKNNNLNDTACVITRYFGGIKLGAGGLVSAYTKAASSAVSAAKIMLKTESSVYSLTVPYADYERSLHIVSSVSGKIKSVDYQDSVNMEIAVPNEKTDEFNFKIAETFAAKTVPVLLYTGYENY